MDGNDLSSSLIDVSNEDDSLLSSPMNDAVFTNNNTSIFFCSPLNQIPRSVKAKLPISSPIVEEEEEIAPSIPSSSNYEEDNSNNNMNKENVNRNSQNKLQQEGPKLSIEPQQMKRKKKGGGFDLRKSLAWDRAFFTEEGILDPEELSMLHRGKETLSVINEGRESLSGDLDNNTVGVDDNLSLSKDLSSSKPNQGRKAAAMSPKHYASPTKSKLGLASAAKRKVLAAHDINRNASKRSGAPRPVASLSNSVRRPPNANANTNTVKGAGKDSRVIKPLAAKPSPSAVSATSKGSTTCSIQAKRNVASQPGNSQRNAGLKGTSGITKAARADAKSVPAGKYTVKDTGQLAKSNVKASSVPEIHSSSSVQIPRVGQVKSTSQVVPDSVVPSVHPTHGHDNNTRNVAVSFSQNAYANGGSMDRAQAPIAPTGLRMPSPSLGFFSQSQIAKPSGLRMPSPSLGFFGQPKPAGSHGQLVKNNQPYVAKSNIPNFGEVGSLNTIQQRPPVASDIIPSHLGKVNLVGSTANAASTEKIKSGSDLNNMQKMELQPKLCSEVSSSTNHSQRHDIHEDIIQQSVDSSEPCKTESISCTKNIGRESIDIKLPVQSGSFEQLERNDVKSDGGICLKITETNPLHSTGRHSLPMEVEGPETNNEVVNPQVEGRELNPSMKTSSVCPDSHAVKISSYKSEATLEVQDQLGGVHEAKSQSSQLAELVKPENCKVESISDVECQNINATFFEDSSQEGLGNCNSSKNEDVPLAVQESGAVSECPAHFPNMEPKKEGTAAIGHLSGESHAEDAIFVSVEGNLLVESDKCLMKPSKLMDSNLMIVDNPSTKPSEQTELTNFCTVKEVPMDICGPLSNGSLVGTCSEDEQVKNIFPSLEPGELRTSDCKVESESSEVPYTKSTGIQNCSFNETGRVENIDVENSVTAFADSEFTVEKNVNTDGNGSTLALESRETGDVIGLVLHENHKVINLCPGIEDLSGRKFVNLDATIQTTPTVGCEDFSAITDSNDREDEIDVHFKKNSVFLSGPLLENDAFCIEKANSVQQSVFPTYVHDANKRTAKLSDETEQVNQAQEMCNEREGEVDEHFEKNSTLFSDPQLDNDISYFEKGNHVQQIDSPTDVQDANEQTADQSKLSVEAQQANHAEEMCNGLSIDESRFFKYCTSEVPHSPEQSEVRQNELVAADVEETYAEAGVGDSFAEVCMEETFTEAAAEATFAKAAAAKTFVVAAMEETFMEVAVEETFVKADMEETFVEAAAGETLVKVALGEIIAEAAAAETFSETATAETFIEATAAETFVETAAGETFVEAAMEETFVEVAGEETLFEADVEETFVEAAVGETFVDVVMAETFVEAAVEETHVEAAVGETFVEAAVGEAFVEVSAGETLVEGAVDWSLDKSSLANSYNCDTNPVAANEMSPTAVDDVSQKNLEAQSVEVVMEHVPENHGLCSSTSAESQENSTLEDVSGTDGCLRESKNTSCLLRQDGVFHVDKHEESLSMDASVDECRMGLEYMNGEAHLSNFESSSKENGNGCTSDPKPFCSLNETINETTESAQQEVREDLSASNISPLEEGIQESNSSSTCETQDELKSKEVEDAAISCMKSPDEKKQEALVIRPPLDAVPFSDEWLAAIEAAGEEILARKGGAVQNSPPDKAAPEPSPWSPVKRKNNQGIGPYDCTKYLNSNTGNPSSTSD